MFAFSEPYFFAVVEQATGRSQNAPTLRSWNRGTHMASEHCSRQVQLGEQSRMRFLLGAL